MASGAVFGLLLTVLVCGEPLGVLNIYGDGRRLHDQDWTATSAPRSDILTTVANTGTLHNDSDATLTDQL